MLGTTEIGGWAEAEYSFVAVGVFVTFTFMVVLLMLNLLIAIMQDAYVLVVPVQSWVVLSGGGTLHSTCDNSDIWYCVVVCTGRYASVMISQPKEKMKQRAKIVVEIERSMTAEIHAMAAREDPRLKLWFPRWIHAVRPHYCLMADGPKTK